MKRERWRIVFLLAVLLVITLFVRLFFLQSNTSFIKAEGDIYRNALVGNQGLYKLSYFSLDELYTKVLSIAMMLLGSYEITGVYLNVFLQTVSIVLIYFSVVLVASEYAAFLVAVIISVIPFYSDRAYEISSLNLLILVYAVGLFAFMLIFRGVYMFAIRKRAVGQETENAVEQVQETVTGVITLDDIIGSDAASSQEEEQEKSAEIEHQEETEVVPPGMKEVILDEEEIKKRVTFIENPLPVPKRRERKEMDFVFALTGENDDYDIKDVSGMDFFDID